MKNFLLLKINKDNLLYWLNDTRNDSLFKLYCQSQESDPEANNSI